MKLVASVIARNEAGRYLAPFIEHLLDFCDEVRVYDDGSRDGTSEILASYERVETMTGVLDISLFDAHEGKARQTLLDWTLEAEPTHILAIDCDEFVSDGQVLRDVLDRGGQRTTSWSMEMAEVWEIDGECLCVRQDSLWRAHPQPLVWKPIGPRSRYRIADRALASGRVPTGALTARPRLTRGVSMLHFGWANPEARQDRYDRYMRIDAGQFHQRGHLESIMWPEEKILLQGRPWPEALDPWREEITARSCRTVLDTAVIEVSGGGDTE